MLRILQINCLDLFLHLDHQPSKPIRDLTEEEWQSLTTSQKGNKPLFKTMELGNTLLKSKADVLIMNEVGGKESLENFNKYFLKDKYEVAIAPGNSKRGIDTGFLVKKGINYSYKGYSSVKKKGDEYKFSRTVNKLTLLKDGKPCLNIFGVHLRSKRNGANDWESTEIRYKEVKGLVELLSRNEKKYKVPYVLAGDFNGNAQEAGRDFEFDPLYDELKIKDIHDLKKSSKVERYSHIHFNREDINYNQLDYIFLSEKLHKKLFKAKRWLYGETYPFTHVVTMSEKFEQPSDHYPQMAFIKINVK